MIDWIMKGWLVLVADSRFLQESEQEALPGADLLRGGHRAGGRQLHPGGLRRGERRRQASPAGHVPHHHCTGLATNSPDPRN